MKAAPTQEISGIQVVNSESALNENEDADNVMNIMNSSFEGSSNWRN